jgi:hypothetical protein
MRLTLDREQAIGLAKATARGEMIEVEWEGAVVARLTPVFHENDEGPYDAGPTGYDAEDEALMVHLARPEVQAYFAALRARMEAGDKLSHEEVWAEVLGPGDDDR